MKCLFSGFFVCIPRDCGLVRTHAAIDTCASPPESAQKGCLLTSCSPCLSPPRSLPVRVNLFSPSPEDELKTPEGSCSKRRTVCTIPTPSIISRCSLVILGGGMFLRFFSPANGPTISTDHHPPQRPSFPSQRAPPAPPRAGPGSTSRACRPSPPRRCPPSPTEPRGSGIGGGGLCAGRKVEESVHPPLLRVTVIPFSRRGGWEGSGADCSEVTHASPCVQARATKSPNCGRFIWEWGSTISTMSFVRGV